MTRRQKLLRIVLPILILLLGVIGMRLLVQSRQAPPKQALKNPGVLVEVIRAELVDHSLQVVGTGTVQSRQEVAITPQVSGRIVGLAPGFQAGGFFRKGDFLFEIEAVDYQLAAERASAALAKAEVDQALVEGQARVAKEEWSRLYPNGTEAPPLVLQQPQLKNAAAAVAAARATLEQARLELARTRIHAPFDCRVRSEEVALGQYVRAATSVALVAGTEAVEIVVPLPLEDLGWLQIPRAGGAGKGSPARVRLSGSSEEQGWSGRIVRSLGEVDSRSRMARVVVAVDDPYGLASKGSQQPDLEIGMFVEVVLNGRTLPQVVALPRLALREGGMVWTVDDEERLHLQPVTVARQEGELALISEGLASGDRVVLTRVSGAAEGLKLRPRLAGELAQ